MFRYSGAANDPVPPVPEGPTFEPTAAPTSKYCDHVYLQITAFNGFTATAMNNDDELQSSMRSLTHNAIALSAADNGVYRDEFWLEFQNASGVLSVGHDLCASYSLYLTALKYVIQSEDDEINSVIHVNLSNLYHNETTIDAMTVEISLNKFSLLLCLRWNGRLFASPI